MLYIIKNIVNFILPPGCFIVILAVCIFIYYKKSKKIPGLITAVLILLYVLSIPVVSNNLIHSLEYKYIPHDVSDGDVIVVLGGGATLNSPDVSGDGNLMGCAANRLITAVRLHNKTNLPIIFSGGKVFKYSGTEADVAKRQLIDLRVNRNDIITEDKSLNTTQNAEFTYEIMKKHKYKRPILITSAFHMRRAVINFDNAGAKNLIPYPCDYITNKSVSISFNSFMPSAQAFYNAYTALHEYLGILRLKNYR